MALTSSLVKCNNLKKKKNVYFEMFTLLECILLLCVQLLIDRLSHDGVGLNNEYISMILPNQNQPLSTPATTATVEQTQSSLLLSSSDVIQQKNRICGDSRDGLDFINNNGRSSVSVGKNDSVPHRAEQSAAGTATTIVVCNEDRMRNNNLVEQSKVKPPQVIITGNNELLLTKNVVVPVCCQQSREEQVKSYLPPSTIQKNRIDCDCRCRNYFTHNGRSAIVVKNNSGPYGEGRRRPATRIVRSGEERRDDNNNLVQQQPRLKLSGGTITVVCRKIAFLQQQQQNKSPGNCMSNIFEDRSKRLKPTK